MRAPWAYFRSGIAWVSGSLDQPRWIASGEHANESNAKMVGYLLREGGMLACVFAIVDLHQLRWWEVGCLEFLGATAILGGVIMERRRRD